MPITDSGLNVNGIDDPDFLVPDRDIQTRSLGPLNTLNLSQTRIIAAPHTITATLAILAHIGGPSYLLALRTTPMIAIRM